MDALDLDLHLLAQLLVERAERLVHQQQPRLRHQRARHRHALLLAAGQLARIARREMRRAAPAPASRRCAAAPGRASAWCACAAESRHCRPPSCAETAHRTGTPCRCCAGAAGRPATERPSSRMSPASGAMNPAIRFERRGFAGAARTEQRHERAGRNVERDVVDRAEIAERLCQVAKLQPGAARLCDIGRRIPCATASSPYRQGHRMLISVRRLRSLSP